MNMYKIANLNQSINLIARTLYEINREDPRLSFYWPESKMVAQKDGRISEVLLHV